MHCFFWSHSVVVTWKMSTSGELGICIGLLFVRILIDDQSNVHLIDMPLGYPLRVELNRTRSHRENPHIALPCGRNTKKNRLRKKGEEPGAKKIYRKEMNKLKGSGMAMTACVKQGILS